MEVQYIKQGKGHDIIINGEWVAWVIGSIKNAKKEAIKYKFN